MDYKKAAVIGAGVVLAGAGILGVYKLKTSGFSLANTIDETKDVVEEVTDNVTDKIVDIADDVKG